MAPKRKTQTQKKSYQDALSEACSIPAPKKPKTDTLVGAQEAQELTGKKNAGDKNQPVSKCVDAAIRRHTPCFPSLQHALGHPCVKALARGTVSGAGLRNNMGRAMCTYCRPPLADVLRSSCSAGVAKSDDM